MEVNGSVKEDRSQSGKRFIPVIIESSQNHGTLTLLLLYVVVIIYRLYFLRDVVLEPS